MISMYLDRNIFKEFHHQNDFLDLSKSTLSVPGVIPYCSIMIAKQDRVKKTSSIDNHDTRCSEFFPSFSTQYNTKQCHAIPYCMVSKIINLVSNDTIVLFLLLLM